jgi:GT2 family glycosyltransferase
MNMGAAQATHPILYFVHADVIVPEKFYSDIVKALSAGEEAGCYRSGFEYYPGLMRINAFVTRFKWLTARGGDQTLFITKTIFQELKGFDESYTIMEDYDIIKRIWAAGKKFTILPNKVVISLRKYKNNSWLRVQYANATAMIMFSRGYSADQIKTKYQKLINPA